MNCNLADVQFPLVKVNANYVDFSLSFDGVEIRLNELAPAYVLEVGGNNLLADIDDGVSAA